MFDTLMKTEIQDLQDNENPETSARKEKEQGVKQRMMMRLKEVKLKRMSIVIVLVARLVGKKQVDVVLYPLRKDIRFSETRISEDFGVFFFFS